MQRQFTASERRFGIRTLAEQGGVCALCGKVPEPPHLDHCHKTNLIRGVLCLQCNLRLGVYEAISDNAEWLARARMYLDPRQTRHALRDLKLPRVRVAETKWGRRVTASCDWHPKRVVGCEACHQAKREARLQTE